MFYDFLSHFTGLYPDDSFDEAVANMICDGVADLFNDVVKIHFEKVEHKKVFKIRSFNIGLLMFVVEIK